MKKEDYIIYDFPSKRDVVAKQIKEALNKMYEISYPKPTMTFEQMNEHCKEILQNESKPFSEGLFYTNDKTGRKYQYPLDFYYVPKGIQIELWDSLKDSYRANNFWREYLEALIDKLFISGGYKDKYVVDIYHPDNKGYSKWKALWYKIIGKKKEWRTHRISVPVKTIDHYIGKFFANKVRKIIENYMHWYRYDSSVENAFAWAFMSTPTTNADTVVEAWEAIGISVEKPDDKKWMSIYEYEEFLLDEEEMSGSDSPQEEEIANS